MKRIIIYILIPIVFILIGWFANTAYRLPKTSNNPISQVRPTPLLKYTIENLSKTNFKPGEIQIVKVLKTDPKFTSYEFSMKFSPDFSDNLEVTSGVINIPVGTGPFPIIVMFRGYVDPTQYFIGEGTQPAATVFAQNGFITIAPDFLGYGDSDHEATDVFESRFQTYVTAATLLKTIGTLEDSPLKVGENSISSINNTGMNHTFDTNHIFIWGHSNGGQIALTTLEITGVDYPTVLWAPVSKPFPYSILYYTDEAPDGGKSLRKYLADFETDYNTDLFSLTRYLSQIKAPIQLNQGTTDVEVPVSWSDDLAKSLKEVNVPVTYIKYPGNDHNMRPNWNQVVENNLKFFQKQIKK
jgi:dienelactone hydrolase